MKSLEDIDKTLNRAKLQDYDVKPLAQAIYFGNACITNHKLLQLDGHLLKSIKENSTVRIIGDSDEKAVICTDNKTYDITNTETSNSLVLIQNLTFSSDIDDSCEKKVKELVICGTFHDYLEVIPGKLKIKKLLDILIASEYSGSENEYKVSPDSLYDMEKLVNVVQGSKREIEQALTQLNVVTIDGNVRRLEFHYHFRVLSYIIGVVDENSWTYDEIKLEETLNTLSDLVPKAVLLGLWEIYMEESNVLDADGRPHYRYHQQLVCQFMACVILRSAKTFNLQDFLQAWAESVPEGMVTEESWLYGIANIDRSKAPATISILTMDMLPIANLQQKLQVLFTAKSKWTVPEITPYIIPDTTDKMDANALLAKYARASTANGIKYYSSKHGK